MMFVSVYLSKVALVFIKVSSDNKTCYYVVLYSGAFKFRGACNAVFSLDDDQAAKGVVTHSRFCFGLFYPHGHFL